MKINREKSKTYKKGIGIKSVKGTLMKFVMGAALVISITSSGLVYANSYKKVPVENDNKIERTIENVKINEDKNISELSEKKNMITLNEKKNISELSEKKFTKDLEKSKEMNKENQFQEEINNGSRTR